MNYYERHIGDYIKNTAHLSLLEHGIYTRLIDVYYVREAPIPDDQAARLIGARTEPETQALQVVLQEFFSLTDGQWVHTRCDEEIAAFEDGEPEREVKKANERNRLKRHRVERAELFKTLTDAGKHAPWNIGIDDLRAQVLALGVSEPATHLPPFPATAPATLATATHSPLPNTHYPEIKAGAEAPPPSPSANDDPVKGMFDRGLTVLGGDGKAARSLLGKLRKQHGDVAVLGAIAAAEAEHPSDPVPWVVAACASRTAASGGAQRETVMSSFD